MAHAVRVLAPRSCMGLAKSQLAERGRHRFQRQMQLIEDFRRFCFHLSTCGQSELRGTALNVPQSATILSQVLQAPETSLACRYGRIPIDFLLAEYVG